MYFGCAWYPEHWPEARWPRDLHLMREAGMNVVRIGEFAWSRFEPSDGHFDFAWLQRAVNAAVEADLQVVLCTPTPTPPAWLTRQHPDILPIRDQASGRRQLHGQRCHVDPANQQYRRYSARIVEALARTFGDCPSVLGWQIDNEFWSMASNPASLAAFRSWLRQEYGTLPQLNERWSTAFWSQEYFAWQDIQAPTDNPNPALWHAWHRFYSQLTADFQALQVRSLRRWCRPQQFITHNFHPFDDFDRSVIAADLDLVAWDAYIMGERLELDPAASGMDCDRIFGLRQRPFWIMETLPGFVNWRPVNRALAPGEMRALAWHLIGHGADAILYWQWRSAPACQEQYHGSLLQQDGEPRPLYAEAAQLGKELQRLAPLLAGTEPVAEVALIDRWVDRQALKKQPHHRDYDPRSRAIDWYRPWQAAGYGVRLIERFTAGAPTQPLLLAPHLHLASDADCQYLLQYINHGGHVLLGPRSVMKDEDNRLRADLQPGPLTAALGACVQEFYALASPLAVAPEVESGICGEAKIFAELLRVTAPDCEVLARFGPGDGWLSGAPALVSRRHGAGRISYLACVGDTELQQSLCRWAARALALQPPLSLPDEVELCRRRSPGDKEVWLLINHGRSHASIALPGEMQEHLSQAQLSRLILAPAACAILTSAAAAERA